MIIGLCEWGMRELPIKEHYSVTNQFGLKHMELGIGGEHNGRLPVGIDDKLIQKLKEYSKKYEVSTPFMCFENDFTLQDKKIIEEKIKEIINDLPACNELGVTHIRLFTGFSSPEEVAGERWNVMIESIKEVAKACDKYSMQISLETHGRLENKGDGLLHYPTTSTDKECLKRLLEQLPKNVGINYDPGNLKPVQDEDVITYLDVIGDRLNYCHLKDWKQLENGSWFAVAIGDVLDTTINWQKLIDEINFDGIYLIEYEPAEDVVDGFKRSIEYLSGIVDVG